jgi:hypothetical protein
VPASGRGVDIIGVIVILVVILVLVGATRM